jgi:hypothetical protein
VNSQWGITINCNCCLLFYKIKLLMWKLKLQTLKSHDLKRMLKRRCYWDWWSLQDPFVIVIIIIPKKMQWGSIIVSLLCTHSDATKQPKQRQSVVAMLSHWLPTLRARLDTREFKEVELKHHTRAVWLTRGKLQFNNLQYCKGIWNLRLN